MRILILLLPLFALLYGQPPNTATIGVRALVLGSAADMPERYLSTKDGYKLLALSSTHPGEFINADTADNLPIFKKVADTGEDTDFRIAESVQLPAGASNVLLLSWNSPDGLRYLSINDNILKASYNNWLFINTASKSIGFRIGEDEKPFFLKANSIEHYRVASPAGKGAAVLGCAKWDGQVKTFYSTYWPIREAERSIVIFTERGERIAVKKISDKLLRSPVSYTKN